MSISMELNTLLNFGAILALGIIGYFLRLHMADFLAHKKETREVQAATSKELNLVKYNYLDRFTGLTKQVTETKENLQLQIHETETRLTALLLEKPNRPKHE